MAVENKYVTEFSKPSDCEIRMTRMFAAPRSMVFDAWTKPALLKQWWGPPGWTLPVCEIDLRVGGAFRFVMSGAGCKEMSLYGVYREIQIPERYVATQRMEGCGGQGDAEALGTFVFTESDGHTTMTQTVRYPSKEVRDRVLNSGARSIDVVYERLDQLLSGGVAHD